MGVMLPRQLLEAFLRSSSVRPLAVVLNFLVCIVLNLFVVPVKTSFASPLAWLVE
jgi:hypothetical protein